MAKFVQTETITGAIYFVNLDLISTLQVMKDGSTAIRFDDQHTLTVSTKVQSILDHARGTEASRINAPVHPRSE
jgi:hypothetical protein